MTIESLNAVTVATHDMAASVRFYLALGFERAYGGPAAEFTSYRVGDGHWNVVHADDSTAWSWWGRAIFYVADVDALHDRAVAAGYLPSTSPADATWGERYFHIADPDGHELSFACPFTRPANLPDPG